MKNKLYILLIASFQIFLTSELFSKEINFKASEIEILNDQNLTVATNGSAVIEEDEIILEGNKIEFFKEKSLIIIKRGKISKIDKSLEISSNLIEYNIDASYINFKGDVNIKNNLSNLIIKSKEIEYDVLNKKIKSDKYSEIFDNLSNVYQVEKFEYSIKDETVKLDDLKVFDKEKNTFFVDLAFLDLKKNELVAKDIALNFKIDKNSVNEPRLKGRSLIKDEKNTIVKKGSFTFCQKREKCPPWELSAEEIRHDKQKKTINYKNASLKLYDKKVFYFPKFFHPDPSVERQTGFLVPKLQDNSTTGLSLNLPYFFIIAQNKDITISPRFYNDDKLLLQSEYRQKNEGSSQIGDLSQFYTNENNSKGHLFYNLNKVFSNKNFQNIDFNLRLEQVSDETYLKAYKIKSPIINNLSELTNSINLNFYDDDLSINTNIDVYEDLSKKDSDKYEYVPNFNFSKVINENYSINSIGYYKNYNTNITEKILINDFTFNSPLNYFNNGIINEKKFLVKNVVSDGKNSNSFKNKGSITLTPTLQSDYLLPLKKDSNKFLNTITPKISLRLSSTHTKDIRNNDRKIDYENIYDLNRLNISDSSEGGISATYGYEYAKIDKLSSEAKYKFGFANNIRFEENKDLPINSNLGDKMSDFVGIFEYKPNNNFKFDYDYSLKNNLSDKNYELFGFEFFLKNLNSKIEYLNENNSNLKTSYLQSELQYKLNDNNSLIFETRENKEKSFTEFYNLIYQYQNDCLTAGIEYNKEFYNDEDLKPSENLFFKISIIPFGGFNSPNLK